MKISVVIAATCSAFVFIHAVHAAAPAEYPTKPIRMVVPQAAGGNTDLIGRMTGDYLHRLWNVPVVIDNRPGAGGNIGIEIVAKAVPDGYTLLVAPPALVTSPALYRKLNYDATRDFAPIAVIALVPQVLVVHPSVPAKSVKELIELARAKPGTLNYGAPGVGSGPHVTGEMTHWAAEEIMKVEEKFAGRMRKSQVS